MATYHATMQIIGRQRMRGGKAVAGKHNSAVAAAAYRGGLNLYDERNGKREDYRRKSGIAFHEILTPEGAPEWMKDPARLWNAVEFREDESNRHAQAQLARELEFSLPVELTPEQKQKLALAVGDEFVKRGMVAQVNIHEPKPNVRGERNPHAHIMLTMRNVSTEGFGNKNRDWNGGFMANGAPDGEALKGWRKMIADRTNEALGEAGSDARVDHRSYESQGVNKLPGVKLGKSAAAMERRGIATRVGGRQRVIKVLNLARGFSPKPEEDESGGDANRLRRLALEKNLARQPGEPAREPETPESGGSWRERMAEKKDREPER